VLPEQGAGDRANVAVVREAGLTAAILSIVFAVWPLVAFLGGAGFSPLAGMAALATAPKSLPRLRFQYYMIAFAAFIVFAAGSALWSPRPFALVELSSLSVRSEVLRWGLLMFAAGMLLAATQTLTERGATWVIRFAKIALVVHFLLAILLAVFADQLIQFFYPGRPTDDGVQNITRNAMFMAVAAPFLILAVAEGRGRVFTAVVMIAVVIAVSGVSMLRELDAGYLALVAAFGCYLVMRVFPRNGFRILGGTLAAFVLAAPLLFQLISAGANAALATNSLQYRQAIWQHVLNLIWQKPWVGSGVGALRMEQDVIPSGVFEGQLYVPNHPHNMLLQLWAETGLVGAALVATILALVAWRLPRPYTLGPATPRIAAIIGGFCASLISFDIWNEAWWAVFCLLGTLAAVHFRQYALATSGLAPQEDGLHKGRGHDAVSVTARVAQMRPAPVPQPRPDHSAVASAYTTNNFNLVRLIFALMVVAYHLVAIPDLASPLRPYTAQLAEVGVQGFFVLSGYLVYASLERSSSLREYAEKRFRRLYPAYAFVILICAGAALIASPAAREDLLGVARYTGWNLIFANFMEPNLPGVFASNPTTEVNGALWTLKIEVMFYVVLPLLLWLIRLGGRYDWICCLVLYVGSEVWRIGFSQIGQLDIARQLPGQLSFFLTGMMLQAAHLTGRRLHVAGAAGAFVFAASLMWPQFEFARAIGLGTVSIWLATGLVRLPDAARFGDLSYGLYIVHAPIIQVCIAMGLFAASAWLGTGAAIAASVFGALLMWHIIEKPALRRDSAYRLQRA
jgi:peptidoglycan/LPS O-acetylase OafA/YrhL/O-antigen ligase